MPCGVTSPPSSAPRWQTLASRIPACSPDKAEQPGYWLGYWGLAHPTETELM